MFPKHCLPRPGMQIRAGVTREVEDEHYVIRIATQVPADARESGLLDQWRFSCEDAKGGGEVLLEARLFDDRDLGECPRFDRIVEGQRNVVFGRFGYREDDRLVYLYIAPSS